VEGGQNGEARRVIYFFSRYVLISVHLATHLASLQVMAINARWGPTPSTLRLAAVLVVSLLNVLYFKVKMNFDLENLLKTLFGHQKLLLHMIQHLTTISSGYHPQDVCFNKTGISSGPKILSLGIGWFWQKILSFLYGQVCKTCSGVCSGIQKIISTGTKIICHTFLLYLLFFYI
jgi:hypothetical protein